MTGPEAPAGPAEVWAPLGAAVDDLARRFGLDDATRRRLAPLVPLLAPRPDHPTPGDGAPPDHRGAPEPVDPASLGEIHQAWLEPDHRHRRGVHYTPSATAATLVALALPPGTEAVEVVADPGDASGAATIDRPLVCDPSCGGGVFLLAAADHLVAHGWTPTQALGAVGGLDLDPTAVEVARAALVLWAVDHGVRGDELVAVARSVVGRVRVGDALVDPWPGEGALAAVVGNPPFGGQLGRDTARGREAAEVARALLGGSAAGYADTAGLFLVRAVGAAAPGARVVLLQPLSFLGSRDAGTVRRRLTDHAALEAVWLADDRLFGASVDVCAPVLAVAPPLSAPAPAGEVAVRRGPAATVVAGVPATRLERIGSWSPAIAAATGVPLLDLGARPVLGSWARATAGFRDEFYALAPFVEDRPDLADDRGSLPSLPPGSARLVTAGLVEPAHTVWGRRATRLAGRRLAAPVVDVAALRAWATGPDGDRRMAAWADARLRPKVVVATQTRVVEAALDDDGTWWPSVPVVSVVLEPERDDPWHRLLVLAALTAPPVTAWAAERSGGTALAPQALKLSARQVQEVPLPIVHERWAAGATELALVAAAGTDAERRRHLAVAGRLLTEAHDLAGREAESVLRWWADRAGCDPEI